MTERLSDTDVLPIFRLVEVL